jgi:hypothetical protein
MTIWCACEHRVLYPAASCYCDLVPDCGKLAIKDDNCPDYIPGTGKMRTMESMIAEGGYAGGHEEIKVRVTKSIIKPTKLSKRMKGQGSLL